MTKRSSEGQSQGEDVRTNQKEDESGSSFGQKLMIFGLIVLMTTLGIIIVAMLSQFMKSYFH